MRNRNAPYSSRVRGFGLVETMVGLVVGLICILVVMQVARVFEEQKRTTTSGSDAQTNAALALYLIEREVRSAGNGMTEGEPQKYPPLAGCPANIYDAAASYLIPNPADPETSVQRPGGTVATVRLAPVIAVDGGGGASDTLTLTYGTAAIAAPYTLTSSYAPGAATINLTSTAGLAVNDMVALIETNTALGTSGNYLTPRTCALLQITSIPAPAVPPAPAIGVAPGARYNRAGGTGLPAFSDEARLYNLGLLSLVTYRIVGTNLVSDVTRFGNTPGGAAPAPVDNRTDFSPLASNIVNMQVQYGVDTGNPGGATLSDCKTGSPGTPLTTADADAIIDDWVDPTGAWANNGVDSPSLFNLRRIRAIRVGLVARTGIKEVNPAGDAACTTTTNFPQITWGAGPAMTPDLGNNDDWRCYRYRVFQATIPVRNSLWSSTMNPVSSASCGLRDPA